MHNSRNKAAVPYVQGYTSNDTNRIAIYAKDIMNITGSKERAARKLLARIRQKYNKESGTFITIFEFCECTGLKQENVAGFLNN